MATLPAAKRKDPPMDGSPAKGSVAGDNRPPLIDADRLAEQFPWAAAELAELKEKAESTWPFEVEDEDDMGVITAAVKEVRALHQRLETNRTETKAEFLDAERRVDAFFKGTQAQVAKLQGEVAKRGDRYLEKKEEAERQERERKAAEEREKARIAAEAAAAAEKARQEAEAARLAAEAEQARLAEERRQAQKAAELANQVLAPAPPAPTIGASLFAAQEASTAALKADLAARTAETARQAAAQATRAAEAKPADLSRTRTAGGTASLAREWDLEMTNRNLVDVRLLGPYLTSQQLEVAARAYMQAKQHLDAEGGLKRENPTDLNSERTGGLPGFRFFERRKGNYR